MAHIDKKFVESLVVVRKHTRNYFSVLKVFCRLNKVGSINPLELAVI